MTISEDSDQSGTKVTIELNVKLVFSQAAIELPQPFKEPSDFNQSASQNHSTKKDIIVSDDQPINIKVLTEHFTQLNCVDHCQFARDYREAIEVATETIYDCSVVDNQPVLLLLIDYIAS